MARVFDVGFHFSRMYFAIFTFVLSVDIVQNNPSSKIVKRNTDAGPSECVKVEGYPTGNITSPGYPDGLPSTFTECDWHLQGQYGQQVILTFVTFDLPHPNVHGQCPAAYLSYGKYDHQGRRVVEKRVCGTLRPQPFHAGTSQAWVSLVITGASSPVNYDMHSGVLISYSYVYTELGENQLLIGLVFMVVIPVLCCVPIIWSYAKKKREKKADVLMAHFREHALKQKEVVEKSLSVIGFSTLNSTQAQVQDPNASDSQPAATQNVAAASSSIIPLPSLSLSLLPLSAGGVGGGWSSLRSTLLPGYLGSSTPRVVVTPLGPQHPLTFDSGAGDGTAPGSNVVVFKGSKQGRRKWRQHKLALAYSAPSMGSISEMEEYGTERDGEVREEEKVSEGPEGKDQEEEEEKDETTEDDDVFVD